MESCSICLFVTDISLSIISSEFIHVVTYDGISPLFKAEKYSVEYISFPIIPDRHLGSFHPLAVVNHASVNMDVKLITL